MIDGSPDGGAGRRMLRVVCCSGKVPVVELGQAARSSELSSSVDEGIRVAKAPLCPAASPCVPPKIHLQKHPRSEGVNGDPGLVLLGNSLLCLLFSCPSLSGEMFFLLALPCILYNHKCLRRGLLCKLWLKSCGNCSDITGTFPKQWFIISLTKGVY